jgi:hypothetical protein
MAGFLLLFASDAHSAELNSYRRIPWPPFTAPWCHILDESCTPAQLVLVCLRLSPDTVFQAVPPGPVVCRTRLERFCADSLP